jgi:hypothetical protein
MFGMLLKTRARSFTLFVPTKDDLAQWIRIFNLICEMNQKGINVRSKNPFSYELEKINAAEHEERKKQDAIAREIK